MTGHTLSLSPATAPFPFSALLLAVYLSVNVNFDPEVSSPVLTTPSGEQISQAEEITESLGKLLADGDSTKVRGRSLTDAEHSD